MCQANTIAARTPAIAAVAVHPNRRSHFPTTSGPMTSFRVASHMAAAISGTEMTPFRTAAQNSMRIDYMGARLNNAPASVATMIRP